MQLTMSVTASIKFPQQLIKVKKINLTNDLLQLIIKLQVLL